MKKLNNGNLKLGVQKNGRLTEETVNFLRSAGLEFENNTQELFSICRNFPVELIYLRDDDIVDYVQSGAVDLGIIGQNLLNELKPRVIKILSLCYGFCSLCLAVPNNSPIQSVDDLKNKTIATSYPNSASYFFNKQYISVKIIIVNGSVEIAPALGIASGIVDLVSTGNTLVRNDLRIVNKLYDSEAVLIANRKSMKDSKKIKSINKLLNSFKSVL